MAWLEGEINENGESVKRVLSKILLTKKFRRIHNERKTEITFMQTRLIRLASEEWHLSVEQIIHLFKEADVFGYIEKCYGIFSL